MTTALTSKCTLAGATGNSQQRWRGANSPAVRLLERLLSWSDRLRQRRQLLSMDDHLLKDIGLTRADIQSEAGKPFWLP